MSADFGSGRLKPLAITSAKRAPQLPGVPTVAESGFPGFEAYNWIGVFAPAATPQAVLGRLHGEFIAALAEADVRQRLGAVGFEIVALTPPELDRVVAARFRRWGRVVRGFKIEFC